MTVVWVRVVVMKVLRSGEIMDRYFKSGDDEICQ